MPGSEPGPVADLYVRDVHALAADRHRSGLHRLTDERTAAEVAAVLDTVGWRTLALTVGPDSDKGGIIAGLAVAGSFPAWVGANWDGLQDALRDLSWAPADGYCVLIDGWDHFAVRARGDATALRSILAESARWWDSAGTPFHVLLR